MTNDVDKKKNNKMNMNINKWMNDGEVKNWGAAHENANVNVTLYDPIFNATYTLDHKS